MEKTGNDMGAAEALPPDSTWWPADITDKLQLITLVSSEDKANSTILSSKQEPEVLASKRASQILWDTGELAEPIPDGFYFVIPERRFKEHFDSIPSLDDLYALEAEGLRPNVILVNLHKDKKLSMLKQLTLTLVKGNSTPSAVVKKIAGLVCDFYKHPKYKSTHVSGTLEEVSHALGSQGIHMLCQIKDGSCHSRAILFKVLADTVGIECKLIVGFPRGGALERTDSSKHICVTVILDSVELLVDLMHYPGKLFPCSTKQLHRSQFFGDIDSVETDSYCSPMEPISPTCISTDYSATGSPEHPFFRGPGRSILGGRTHSFKDCSYDVTASSLRTPRLILPDACHLPPTTGTRSAGASPIHTRRRRRRSISMIPEIGDDIVRVVREMNASMKKNHLSGKQATFDLSTRSREDNSGHQESVLNFRHDLNTGNEEKGQAQHFHGKCLTSDKAISLPSSPHWTRGKAAGFFGSPDLMSRLDKVIESSRILNKPLLPFDEWNIDFSEITIGARVGIGFFGEVFRCIWNGTEVAVKVFLEQDLTEENIEDFANEISILSRIRHPNVILFLGACTTPPRLSVVTEFMEMGSLYHLIHVSGQKNNLSWQRRLKMLCDICRGLMCIHRMKIVHRDLKSGNCLVNKNYKVKICDFGLSRLQTSTPMRDSSSAGTPEWMAPELIRNEPFTEKCDIFSLGVIIWELYTLKKPWEGVPPVQVVYAVANDGKRLEIPEGPLGKLIADCWAEPDERPSCEEILSRLRECRSSTS